MINNNPISERIINRRLAQKLTQAQLAEKMAVGLVTINRWERGHTIPNHNKLSRLSEVLQCPLQYLLHGDVEYGRAKFPFAENIGRIAYQGVECSYSHISARSCYPNHTAIGCESFNEAFDKLKTGQVDLAMIPIENSSAGRVADIHFLINQGGVYIIAEHYQPVRHCLMVLPGVDIKNVSEVLSHPQALSQCQNNLAKMGLKPKSYPDTAGAAESLRLNMDSNHAAIASKMAAERYGLEIVREGFNDNNDNTTRFIVLSRQTVVPDYTQHICITSIIFHLRSIPAALYKCLGGFATNNINLIKLESYIPMHQERTAGFYLEFIGHPEDSHVKQALEECRFFSKDLNILGTYPMNRNL